KDFNEIYGSIEGEFMSREQIHRKIAKKWNVAYSIINELYEDSKELENNDSLGKIDLFKAEMSIPIKDKSDAIYSRVFLKVDKSNPLEDIHVTTKSICELLVTEIMSSNMVDLTDEQIMFWRGVQNEIEKL
ncbi:hypothetical protein EB155_12690, partial [archaeon]|nr:hypothetical protein [archaeon]